jgi:hypothetical protein
LRLQYRHGGLDIGYMGLRFPKNRMHTTQKISLVGRRTDQGDRNARAQKSALGEVRKPF